MDVAEPWEPVGYSSGTPSSTESVDFSEFKVALADFRTKLMLRITEISNRIGYLNSKDVADGGYHRSVNSLTIAGGGATYSAGTLTATGGGQETDGIDFSGTYTVDGSGTIDSVAILNSGTGYTSIPTIVISHSGDGNGSITATLSPVTKSVSGTNLGFQGYVFPTGTTGRGYANTVYSHANFLGGKKINLLGKVLKAIVGVQAMYDSVTTKRSEYYEYNQAV